MTRDEIAIEDRKIAQEARIQLADMRACRVFISDDADYLLETIELRGIGRWSEDARDFVRLVRRRRGDGGEIFDSNEGE